MMIRCLIIDDEEPARNLIRLHLSGLDRFQVIGSLSTAAEALELLQREQADLVFSDIHMPKMSGLDLVRSLPAGPKWILTTAYREHAVEAFEIDVFDYLLKPVTQERFMKAIGKFLDYWDGKAVAQENAKLSPDAFLFFKIGREQVKIILKDILYVEGLADYVKIHTQGKAYIASEKLGGMQELLPANAFTRIHKSFIVAMAHVTGYNADQVFIHTTSLPIGRLYKAGFLKTIQNL